LSQGQGGDPMQTECSADLFGFAPVERRAVVAGFDGGRMTSDAGALTRSEEIEEINVPVFARLTEAQQNQKLPKTLLRSCSLEDTAK